LDPIGAVTCTPASPAPIGPGSDCHADVTYHPNANANGSDGFSFLVNDGALSSAEATVSIGVTPVNDPPVCTDTAAIVATGPANTATINVLASCTDVEAPA